MTVSIGEDNILNYGEVRQRLGRQSAHLLLGNGFSIACDTIFSYGSLYKRAIQAGLSEQAQRVFERLGSNNFEGAMRLLDDTDWVVKTYNIVQNESPLAKDLLVVKQTLIEVLAKSHLNHPGYISDQRKQNAVNFLKPYHSIFTTNYDLLLYWVIMFAGDELICPDGFYDDKDVHPAKYLVFQDRPSKSAESRKGIYYLHGALHLYVHGEQIRKHSWIRNQKRLTDLVKEGLENKQYPLFVAEGRWQYKLKQIQTNPYLYYCLEKFRQIDKPLVTFGHGLGTTDEHILRAIAQNRKLRTVYVGLHGDPLSEKNRITQTVLNQMVSYREKLPGEVKPLEIKFYLSQTARVWD